MKSINKKIYFLKAAADDFSLSLNQTKHLWVSPFQWKIIQQHDWHRTAPHFYRLCVCAKPHNFRQSISEILNRAREIFYFCLAKNVKDWFRELLFLILNSIREVKLSSNRGLCKGEVRNRKPKTKTLVQRINSEKNNNQRWVWTQIDTKIRRFDGKIVGKRQALARAPRLTASRQLRCQKCDKNCEHDWTLKIYWGDWDCDVMRGFLLLKSQCKRCRAAHKRVID